MLMQDEREQIVEYGKLLAGSGLCPGTSGNLSIYNAQLGLMAISPSGMDYFSTRPEDVVITDLEARIADGLRKPSSEWALHTAFYKAKPQTRAVVHSHSTHCAALSALGEPIRAVHFVILDAGVDTVPCAPYRTFGTQELADVAVEACGESRAVLLANHGIVCCGSSLKDAYGLTLNMEYVAQVQLLAMAAGKPNILSPEQMQSAGKQLESYGQPKEKAM